MAISPKLLGDGEHIIVSTRTHWKALVIPVLVLLITCAVAGFLVGIAPSSPNHRSVLVVVALALLVVLFATVRPFLAWLTASYTVTNRRLIDRSGLLTRQGRVFPLQRINDVKYERGLLDRLLGCGTLVISGATEEGRSVLRDVPHVEKLQLVLADLLSGDLEGTGDRSSTRSVQPRRG